MSAEGKSGLYWRNRILHERRIKANSVAAVAEGQTLQGLRRLEGVCIEFLGGSPTLETINKKEHRFS